MSEPVAHLYAHIPFCPAKCPYCAFVTHVGSLKLLEPYLAALVREAEGLARVRPGGPLRTVYFGGGTPSLMSPDQIRAVLAHLDRLFGLTSDCEVTLEAHPATVDPPTLQRFRAAGVTRLSTGGESLSPAELSHLGRKHTSERVLEVIDLARQAGYDSVNVDFMYGIPLQTLESWEETLQRALGAEPDHLSLYPLSIEPRTVFCRRWKERMLEVPGDDLVAEMYHLACRKLRAAGYYHYEVANWALPGHRSQHNLAYWYNRDFYAIGVGAHGYLRPYRTENVTQTRRYIDLVLSGACATADRVHVDPPTELAETIMLRLRLLEEGLDLADLRSRFGLDLADRRAGEIAELVASGLLQASESRLLLTEAAVPVANEVWQRFM